jgi:hypothetical protein
LQAHTLVSASSVGEEDGCGLDLPGRRHWIPVKTEQKQTEDKPWVRNQRGPSSGHLSIYFRCQTPSSAGTWHTLTPVDITESGLGYVGTCKQRYRRLLSRNTTPQRHITQLASSSSGR